MFGINRFYENLIHCAKFTIKFESRHLEPERRVMETQKFTRICVSKLLVADGLGKTAPF